MKLGIVVYTADSETIWNAFRLGLFACIRGDQVKVFLLAKGVEAESMDTDRFNITEQMRQFIDHGGEILACGTCIKMRQDCVTEMCPVSTMADLYNIISESEKVVTL